MEPLNSMDKVNNPLTFFLPWKFVQAEAFACFELDDSVIPATAKLMNDPLSKGGENI